MNDDEETLYATKPLEPVTVLSRESALHELVVDMVRFLDGEAILPPVPEPWDEWEEAWLERAREVLSR